jgi:hypothetical protein
MKKFFCFIFLGCFVLSPLNLHGARGFISRLIAFLFDTTLEDQEDLELVERKLEEYKHRTTITAYECSCIIDFVRNQKRPLHSLAVNMSDEYAEIFVNGKMDVMSSFLHSLLTFSQALNIELMHALIHVANQHGNNKFAAELWVRMNAALSAKASLTPPLR